MPQQPVHCGGARHAHRVITRESNRSLNHHRYSIMIPRDSFLCSRKRSIRENGAMDADPSRSDDTPPVNAASAFCTEGTLADMVRSSRLGSEDTAPVSATAFAVHALLSGELLSPDSIRENQVNPGRLTVCMMNAIATVPALQPMLPYAVGAMRGWLHELSDEEAKDVDDVIWRAVIRRLQGPGLKPHWPWVRMAARVKQDGVSVVLQHYIAAHQFDDAVNLVKGVRGGIYEGAEGASTTLIVACHTYEAPLAMAVLRVIDADTSVSCPDRGGSTALHVACDVGTAEMASVATSILGRAQSAGALTLQRNTDGATPLHIACRRNLSEVAMIMIELSPGALSIQDKRGDTPLHLACKICSPVLALKMLANHAGMCSLRLINAAARTALHEACWAGHEQVAISILKNCDTNRSVRVQDKHRRDTALHVACRQGMSTAALMMVQLGPVQCNLPARNARGSGWTALHEACKQRLVTVAEAMLDYGPWACDLPRTNNAGRTALYLACAGRMGGVALKMLTFGSEACNVSCVARRNTALHVVCSYGMSQVAHAILSLPSSQRCLGVVDAKGSTPLMLACRMRMPTVALRMLRRGAATCALAAVDKDGHTALMRACKMRLDDVAMSILEFGADECQLTHRSALGLTAFSLAASADMKRVMLSILSYMPDAVQELWELLKRRGLRR